MQTISRSTFTTVKTEGAILPADLLQRIAAGDLEGLLPQDYHLAPTEKPNEAINRAWNRCLAVWQSFDQQRQTLSATDSGLTLTRERWLLILFQELGYGRLTYQGKLYAGSRELGVGNSKEDATPQSLLATAYPISHLWEQTPIHLVSVKQALDKRDPAIKRSPHSLMQEFLNHSPDHLWGFVSNGLTLRLLRDNVSLTRAAYLEFDLELMMTGELYADFSLLWLVCHQSRVELLGVGGSGLGIRDESQTTKPEPPATNPSNCWLERWSQSAAEQGTRALDALRDGVQDAISALGRGFLAHPANAALRKRLQTGDLSTQDYYRQVLRLVYRLIFLFVAEDRDLLLVVRDQGFGDREQGFGISDEPRTTNHEPRVPNHEPPTTKSEIRERYAAGYSLSRLRTLSEKQRGSPHPDQYRALRLLFRRLNTGYAPLGLPALGSFLFSNRATPALDEADLANRDLLKAIRALAFTIENNVRRPVDYKNLGAEELGSVYESLLELHPDLNIAAATFTLRTAAGSERKTTGSYYTPTSLITSLLDTALEPVIEERLKGVRGSGLGVGNEPRTTNPQSQITNYETQKGVKNVGSQQLSRPAGVADGDDSGYRDLQSNTNISKRGDVRPDQPTSASGSVGAGEHRRGVRTPHNQGLSQFPDHSPRFDDGSRDTTPNQPQSELSGTTTFDSIAGTDRSSGSLTQRPDHLTPPEIGIGDSGLGISDSGLGKNHESRTTNPQPLTTNHEPLTPEQALLSIKVVDPACGSGHFLIAAANRLALHLGRIRTGDDEPGPEARRESLRDVVRHCIYGVDINEMSVELCKVALWMETLDPGKPLGFLDANIQCGNSLLGATPELLKGGIPDEAFSPITGDDKAYCSEWKARNKKERGQRVMDLDPQPWDRLGDLAAAMADLNRLSGDTPDQVRAQETGYADLVRSSAYEYSRLWADSWCAAFVWIKKPDYYGGYAYPITEAAFRKIERNPFDVAIWMRQEIERLRDQYQFFHWHLAFPHVFGVRDAGNVVRDAGLGIRNEPQTTNPQSPTTNPQPRNGFDVVLGNPPWERIKLQEKEWFAVRNPEIANAPNAAERSRKIAALPKENPALYADFQADKRKAEGDSAFVRTSGRYPLCGRGDVNTYTIFAELSRQVQNNSGRAGIIVPSGIATDDTTKFFFQELMDTGTLASLFDFENREKIFAAVDSRMKFCLLTLRGADSAIASEGDLCPARGKQSPALSSVIPVYPRQGAQAGIQKMDSGHFSPKNSGMTDTKVIPVYPRQGAQAGIQNPAEFVFFALNTRHLADPDRRFSLTAAEIALLNPNTRTCPIFRSKRDAELTKAIYRRVPVLINEETGANPWGIKFMRMFDMSNDSGLFRTRRQLEADGWQLQGNRFVKPAANLPPAPPSVIPVYPRQGAKAGIQKMDSGHFPAENSGMTEGETYLRLYEGRLGHQFNHRFATQPNGNLRELSLAELQNSSAFVESQYYVPDFEVNLRLERRTFACNTALLGYRRVTNNTNERTSVTCILPWGAASYGWILSFGPNVSGLSILCANYNSFIFDYLLRNSLSQPSIPQSTFEQLPVLPPETYSQPCKWGFGISDSGFVTNHEPQTPNHESPTPNPQPLSAWLLPRVLELTCTAWDLQPFAQDCGYFGAPFRWDEDRRFLLRCELDAAYFHLYGIARDDAAYILDTFPIVKRKDIAAYGEYRTQRVILEIFDAMQAAMDSGAAYQTRLNPPPADPAVAHPWDNAFGEPPEPGKEWKLEAGVRDSGFGVSNEPRTTSPQPRTTSPRTTKSQPQTTNPQQDALLPVMPAPQGPRQVRLKRAMSLGGDQSPLATRELVAFLADEDSNIRWLAGSSLVQRPNADTVAALSDFLSQAEPERVARARSEARRVLSVIADTAAEESVRQSAGSVLGGFDN